ncbi:MAG: hypothetical protein ACRCTR_07095 [Actinomycetota bacterium]
MRYRQEQADRQAAIERQQQERECKQLGSAVLITAECAASEESVQRFRDAQAAEEAEAARREQEVAQAEEDAHS